MQFPYFSLSELLLSSQRLNLQNPNHLYFKTLLSQSFLLVFLLRLQNIHPKVGELVFPSSSSNQNPIMQSSSSSSSNHYPIPESDAYSNQNPIMELCSSSSCFCHSIYTNHRIVQNRASQSPTFGLHYPSSSNDPSSSHQDLASVLALLNVSDRGSSNLLRSRSPSLQFDNEALYRSLLYRLQTNELENRVRTQEAFAAQMPSSSSSSPRRDYHQSMGSTQFRNLCQSCLRFSAFPPSSLQPDYNRTGPPSYSNRLPLSSDSMYTEFENSRGSNRYLKLAKEQEGCRYLLKRIEGGRASDIENIFSELKDDIDELMTDAIGNNLVQRLFEACNDEQRTEMILFVTKKDYELVVICLDTHGARVVQKWLELLTNPNQINLLITALRPGTIKLINDVNGHHVVECCFQNVPHEYNKCLIDEIVDNCVEVAMNQNGCCVLQKCLGCSEGEQRECLLSEIIVNALLLSQDQYGNYVVQFVLELRIPHVTARMVEQLEGNYASLSMQKYSSNVVEKCLKLAREEQSTRIIRELIESPHAVLIMQDAFGNYVMQSAWKVSKGPIHHAIVNLVERVLPTLSSHPFGKRVVDCIWSKKDNTALFDRKAAHSFH